MTYIIHIADPARDYGRVAELLNTFERQKVTAEILRGWDSRSGEGTIRRRTVAVDGSGRILGYCTVAHDTWDTPGFFVLWVIVDFGVRGRGIGTALYDEALAYAHERGATSLGADVLDSDPLS